MHFLSSLLFVVASFAFIYFWFNFTVDLVASICKAIASEPVDKEFKVHIIGAGAAFAYMMLYLFIW